MSKIQVPEEESLRAISARIASSARLGRQLKFDDQGRAIPPTQPEMAEDHIARLKALEENAAIPDDRPGSDEEVWRTIDAGRPERPLFRELYDS